MGSWGCWYVTFIVFPSGVSRWSSSEQSLGMDVLRKTPTHDHPVKWPVVQRQPEPDLAPNNCNKRSRKAQPQISNPSRHTLSERCLIRPNIACPKLLNRPPSSHRSSKQHSRLMKAPSPRPRYFGECSFVTEGSLGITSGSPCGPGSHGHFGPWWLATQRKRVLMSILYTRINIYISYMYIHTYTPIYTYIYPSIHPSIYVYL